MTAGLVVMLAILAGMVKKPEDTIGALTAIVFVALMAVVRRDRVAGLAVNINIALLAGVPIFYIHNYGVLKDAIPAACVAASLIAIARRGLRPFLSRTVGMTFVPFLAITWLITLRSRDLNGVRNLEIFTLIALPIMLLSAGLNHRERQGAHRWMAQLAILEGAFAIAESHVLHGPIWGRLGVTGVGQTSQIISNVARSQGTFGSPIPLALFLVVGFAIISTGSVKMKKRNGFISLAIIAAGTLYTGSHSALAIEGVVLILSLGVGRDWGAKRFFAIVAVLTIVVLAVVSTGAGQAGVVTKFAGSYSVIQRQQSWQSVPRLLKDQDTTDLLVGNGYYSEARIFTTGLLPTDGFGAIDDQWVTTLVESGLAGSLLMFSLYVAALRRSDKRFRVVLYGMFAMYFTFDILLWPSATVVAATLFGLAVGTQNQQETPITEPQAGEPSVRAGSTERRSTGRITS